MKLLCLEDVADRLSTSRSTARRLLISGVIPVITLRSGPKGRRMLRVRPEALERWILINEKRSPIGVGKSRRRYEATTFTRAQERAVIDTQLKAKPNPIDFKSSKGNESAI